VNLKPLLIVSALALSLSASGACEAAEPLTFSDFLDKTQAHYPRLKAQQLRAEEALAAEHAAVAGFFPRFKGISEWTRSNDPVYVFGTLLKQGAFTQGDFDVAKLNDPDARSNFAVGVEGQWTLFDAFDTISKVNASKHRAQSEKLNEEFAGAEVSLLAIEAFYRAVLEENLAALAEDIWAVSGKDIGEAESLSQKGLILGADYYAARVNMGAIERMKNRFARDARSSKILLNVLMGEDPLKEQVLSYEVEPAEASGQGLAAWLETAYGSRKDLEAAHSLVEAAKAESFKEKMSFLPKLQAIGRFEDDTRDWRGDRNHYLLGVKGEMDLFDPSYGARKDQAALKLKETIETKNALKDEIVRSLTEEYGRYETILADVPVTARMLEDVQKAAELTEKLYREGKKSVADLLEIRRIYLESAVQAFETRFYTQTGRSRLLFLSGTLDRAQAEDIGRGLKKK